MFAVQKTSIARNTVVCAAQKPVQAKVRRERRISRQQEIHRGIALSGLCPRRSRCAFLDFVPYLSDREYDRAGRGKKWP